MIYHCRILGVELERPIVIMGQHLTNVRSAAKAELRRLPAGAFAEIAETIERVIERVTKESA